MMAIIQFSDIAIVVTGAAQAVRDEIISLGCGDVNRFCPLVPGEIAADECDCGQLAQTIVEIFPSNVFPTPAIDAQQTPCGPQLSVVSVSITLYRCVPGPSDNGTSPSCDALLRSAIIMECDRQSVRTAVACYLINLRDTYQIHDFAIGSVTSVGPDGGCVGVQMSYQFAISNICCG